jgi:ribonuclease HI
MEIRNNKKKKFNKTKTNVVAKKREPREEFHKMFCDGSSLNNPGHAGAGYVIYDPKGNKVKFAGIYLGDNLTNNEAEYNSLIYGLTELVKITTGVIEVRMDSALVINHLNGRFSIKSEKLTPLYNNALILLRNFKSYRLIIVEREKNGEADRLAHTAAKYKKNTYS